MQVSTNSRKRLILEFCLSILTGYVLTVFSVGFLIQSDTAFHIRVGRDIISRGEILTRDIYSWTVVGKHWFSHEWLWEVIAYLVYRTGGYTGLFVFTTVQVALITFLGLVLFRNSFFSKLIFLMGLFTAAYLDFIRARPHVTAALFFLLLIALEDTKWTAKRRLINLFGLFVLFALWSNIHSSAVLGLVFLILLNCTVLRQYWFRIVVAFLASLLNPQFIKLYYYFFKFVLPNPMTETIREWLPPNFHDRTVLFYFVVVIFVTIIGFKYIAGGKKHRILYFILVLAGISSFANAVRNIFIATIFVSCALREVNEANIQFSDSTFERIWKVRKELLGVFTFCLVLATVTFVTDTKKYEHFWPDNKVFERTLSEVAPLEAIKFMKNHGYTDRVFNSYFYGQFLMAEGIKCFIDTRADYYVENNEKLYKEFMDSTSLRVDEPEKILEKYKVKYVLLSTEEEFAKYLLATRKYKLLYRDKKAVVLKIR